MDVPTFEHYSLIGSVGFLISYMFFIMWNLAKNSKAGKFGTFMIFVVLGLGMFGFIAKTVMTEVMAM